jgi:hypothetical protein
MSAVSMPTPIQRVRGLRVEQRQKLAAERPLQETVFDKPPRFPHRADGQPNEDLRLGAFEPLLHRIALVAVGEDDH